MGEWERSTVAAGLQIDFVCFTSVSRRTAEYNVRIKRTRYLHHYEIM